MISLPVAVIFLPIGGRGTAHGFLEYLCKIKIITVSYLGCDGKNGLVCVGQKPQRMINTQSGEKTDKGNSHLMFEKLTGIIGIDGTMFCQITDGDIFLIVPFRIINDHLDRFVGGSHMLAYVGIRGGVIPEQREWMSAPAIYYRPSAWSQ